jgi:hypothetical protein
MENPAFGRVFLCLGTLKNFDLAQSWQVCKPFRLVSLGQFHYHFSAYNFGL